MRDVTATFARWKTLNDKVKALQQAVEQHDPERDAPLVQLQAELREHHEEAGRLLTSAQLALHKIKTPRSSSGDSTWG
jgi:hypothetical protein